MEGLTDFGEVLYEDLSQDFRFYLAKPATGNRVQFGTDITDRSDKASRETYE